MIKDAKEEARHRREFSRSHGLLSHSDACGPGEAPEGDDLLVANPNHTGAAWRSPSPSSSESDPDADTAI